MPSPFKRSVVAFSLFLALFCTAPNAHADTVNTFDVSGSLLQGGTFSGTLTIDVTSGTVTALDITFPTLSAFSTFARSIFDGPDLIIFAVNDPNPDCFTCWFVDFTFSTAPTPGSLVGFTGGTIIQGAVVYTPTDDAVFNITSGSISAASAVTPEPSSIALMLAGVGLLFAMRTRTWGSKRAS